MTKLYNFRLLLLTFLLCAIVSCKNKTGELPSPSPTTPITPAPATPIPNAAVGNCLLHKINYEGSNFNVINEYVYDKHNKIVRLNTSRSNSSVIDSTSFVYDSQGKVSKVNYFMNGSLHHYVTFEHDAKGLLSKYYQYGKSTADSKIQLMDELTYEYNMAHQLIAIKGFNHTSSDSLFAHYAYDSKGNNTQILQYVKYGSVTQLYFDISYEYDDKKNPFYLITSMAYDSPFRVSSQNNVIHFSQTIWGSRVINQDTLVTTNKYTYEYNASDFPIKQTYSSSQFSQRSKTITASGIIVGVYEYNPCQ
jgi:hypothetical protein